MVLGSLEGKGGYLCVEERGVRWSAVWYAGIVDVCQCGELVLDVEEIAVDWDEGRVVVEVLWGKEGLIVGFRAIR